MYFRAVRSSSVCSIPFRRVYSSAHQLINPIKSILIANRGEIAIRVSRTASEYGIKTTTVFTEPDSQAAHVCSSSHSVNLGAANAYLDVERVIAAAKKYSCDSIHPGYGFLSENAHFAIRCNEEGLVFIGPSPEAIERMGNKSESKRIMTDAGVPCVPGYHGSNQNSDFLLSKARGIGFPILIKAIKGGGGKGMRIVYSEQEFLASLNSAKSESKSSFGDDTVLIERYIKNPRHIEVQVFADQYGSCVSLGERDCSVQRRHQKIIEESPAPSLEQSLRKDIWKKARDAALAVKYKGAGTVEFIFDNETGQFFFMEMNTRLQVEHPVTEMVTNLDLVHWQILVASGHPLPLTQEQVEQRLSGHAFEARIYAENPMKGFIPDSGKLLHIKTPHQTENVRVDAGFRQGDEITTFYDPMISKLIVRGVNRDDALRRLNKALEDYEIAGPATNIEFMKRLVADTAFIAGELETGFIEKHHDRLFAKHQIPIEIYSQAALSILMQDAGNTYTNTPFGILAGRVGFDLRCQPRRIIFRGEDVDHAISVDVQQSGRSTFDVVVGDRLMGNVTVLNSNGSPIIKSLYSHARLETTVIRNDQILDIFHGGHQYQLQMTTPIWQRDESTLFESGVKAPMPCKVLKVLASPGDSVVKDQPLLVIESMKMETIIRSPQEGIISQVIHQEGDVVKAGVALVSFLDNTAE